MNILITGGNGFIGAPLCRALKLRHHVTALIRSGSNNQIANDIFIKEITPTTDFSKILNHKDIVIHLAGRVHVPKNDNIDSYDKYKRENLESTYNLAKQSAKKGIKRFIFLSSSKVYGALESNNKSISIDDEVSPQDYYGASKLDAEKVLNDLSRQTKMEVVIIRSPLVYGPGVKANFELMMKFLALSVPLPFGSINNKKSFVYLENLIDLIITTVSHPNAANQTFLVSDDYDVSTTFLIKSLLSEFKNNTLLFPFPKTLLRFIFILIGKPAWSNILLNSNTLNISKTKNILNWKPPVSFKNGIKTTAKSFLDNIK